MVHRDTQKGGMMGDPIYNMLCDFFCEERTMSPEDFEEFITDYGYMIVPIEDPTNLFGVMEDSL